ncbi:5-(carboxyamino)imidazole ribonucleotide mutase [Vulgatibacter incomptus]|uniref:N5-carboxyaminoimidazole ribonucleotide mutase n=1 Tax=Vulgatibacter incomptus TaxID=1391653 RepID=A0A0K1PDB3_9BACT|nr:5-(carboxyamino)imidazole ribonucleotide mutase [Vulgatibacter incomptus]AKU91109.1 Phosphoribosylaminoimidazole carboxylase catalytic subunit [Vulgatibacter incomptus]
MSEKNPRVLILMGSDSDWTEMSGARDALAELGIACDVRVSSAHRTPERTHKLVHEAPGRGIEVIICGAGAAAHLAGVVAASTILPVIGVPLAGGSTLSGMDALLATAQMPGGVPVATVAIGKAGAKNAGYLAARIMALHDKELARRLEDFVAGMAAAVEEKDRKLQEKL